MPNPAESTEMEKLTEDENNQHTTRIDSHIEEEEKEKQYTTTPTSTREKEKSQWSVLAGSLRSRINIQKAFQKLNASLLDEKQKFDVKTHDDLCMLAPLEGRQSSPNFLTSGGAMPDHRRVSCVSLLDKESGNELLNYFIELSQAPNDQEKVGKII